jgi:hypothetical protein
MIRCQATTERDEVLVAFGTFVAEGA